MTREEVFQYAAAQYGTEPAYLWRKYPRYAVLRHDQGKWYGLVVNVSAKTLGLDAADAEQDVLVVKGDPEEIAILQQSRGLPTGIPHEQTPLDHGAADRPPGGAAGTQPAGGELCPDQ
jgi:Uncharacterized protein conserved in bacteria